MSETQEFADLQKLFHDGLLTEAEHARAQQKLFERSPIQFRVEVPESNGTRRAATHRRPPSHRPARWRSGRIRTWILSATVFVIAVLGGALITLGVARHSDSKTAAPRITLTTPATSPAVVAPLPVRAGSPLSTAEPVNLKGSTAMVTVSDLRLDTSSALSNTTETAYSVQVTVVGVFGSFHVVPTYFSAQSAAGSAFTGVPATAQQLGGTTIDVGTKVAGRVEFVVPRGQAIAAIVFTTPLGEQLGLWSVT